MYFKIRVDQQGEITVIKLLVFFPESITDRKYIAKQSCLDNLIRHDVGETCFGCEAIIAYSFRKKAYVS